MLRTDDQGLPDTDPTWWPAVDPPSAQRRRDLHPDLGCRAARLGRGSGSSSASAALGMHGCSQRCRGWPADLQAGLGIRTEP